MENISEEIVTKMMAEQMNLGDEFYPLPPLFPQVEDALMEEPAQVNKLFWFEIKKINNCVYL